MHFHTVIATFSRGSSSPSPVSVKPGLRHVATVLLICRVSAYGQSFSLSGQASLWTAITPGNSPSSQSGLRYIPGLTIRENVTADLASEVDLSLNGFAIHRAGNEQHPDYEANLRLYRASIRLSSDEFELRGGLQKISFGSATLLRPLMWFDRVDPRDPLQLTDGVYGLLARYYFLNNANLWLWGLYGNNNTKGWELAPTAHRSAEYGGRVQIPLWTGETGLSYHHRQAAYPNLNSARAPEDRIALDGKWDLGIGAWFEAVLVRTQSPGSETPDQKLWTVGADYTFDIGNGLTALTEYFGYNNPLFPDGTGAERRLSALSLSYPLGMLDRISAIVYHDWTAREWYRLATWQRTYDNWIIYLIGYWNPRQVLLYGTGGNATAFAGTGAQLMLVFNH